MRRGQEDSEINLPNHTLSPYRSFLRKRVFWVANYLGDLEAALGANSHAGAPGQSDAGRAPKAASTAPNVQKEPAWPPHPNKSPSSCPLLANCYWPTTH